MFDERCQGTIVDLIGFDDYPWTERLFDPYQWWMSDLLCEHEAAMLGAFMGSGKTAVVLYAFARLRFLGLVERMLVVAPLRVAEETWPEEIDKWSFSMGLRYVVLTGDPKRRVAALDKDVDIYIMNRENLGWLYGKMRNRLWIFDVLTYDEASRLKSGKKMTPGKKTGDGRRAGMNFTEFGYLCKMAHLFGRRWNLTGTPSPNGLVDLWGPIYLLDFGKRLGTKRSAFLQRWFKTNQYTYSVVPLEHAENQIMDRLKDIFWYLNEDDFIELPEIQTVDRWVTLSKKTRRMYDDFERTMCIDELDVEAVTNGVLCNKLLQFANGSVYASEDEDDFEYDKRRPPVAKYVHDRKLHELASIVEESGGRSLLIAYSYKFDVHAIKKRFPQARVFGETRHDKKDWNKGRIRMMVLHPASRGAWPEFSARRAHRGVVWIELVA